MKIKFITCIYNNLYGTDLGGRPNRRDHYKWSLLSLLKMTNADFLCYTQESEFEELIDFFYTQNNISPDKLQIKIFDLRTTKYTELIHSVKDYDAVTRDDRCVEIQYSKFDWFRKEDGSYDYYFWIDAGLSHTGLIPNKYLNTSLPMMRCFYESSLFNNKFLSNVINYCGDKFLLLAKENARNYWSGTVNEKFYKNYSKEVHIIGGMFGGKKELWDKVVNQFDDYLFEVLPFEGRLYHEEHIMSLMYQNHKEWFTTQEFDTWWHPESAPKDVHPEYFEKNKSFCKILEDLNE